MGLGTPGSLRGPKRRFQNPPWNLWLAGGSEVSLGPSLLGRHTPDSWEHCSVGAWV